MAIQTEDGITTPGVNDSYDYSSQLAFMAETIQLALEKRANTRIGTASERTVFRPLAKEGTIWVDTSGEKAVWVKQGNAWKKLWPEEDSGWVTSFLRAQSGWKTYTGTANRVRRIGDWVSIAYRFTRNGAAISVPATGDIPNQTVAILNPEWRPKSWQTLDSGESGRVASFSVGSNGHLRLNAVGGTANIANGNGFSIRGWYRLNFE